MAGNGRNLLQSERKVGEDEAIALRDRAAPAFWSCCSQRWWGEEEEEEGDFFATHPCSSCEPPVQFSFHRQRAIDLATSQAMRNILLSPSTVNLNSSSNKAEVYKYFDSLKMCQRS
ncbi:hypothetical protein ACLB2K_061586 [Fragaria x ananassa]